jgi:carboxyl-terminal processing protease
VRNAHYDTAMRGIDWSGVRDELRPRAERAETLGELRAVITDMLTRLGESHYGIIRKEADDALPAAASDPAPAREPGDVGMSLRLIGSDVVVSQVVRGGPADRAGVRAGWIVDSVGRFARRRAAAGLSRLSTDAERRMALVRVPRAVTA